MMEKRSKQLRLQMAHAVLWCIGFLLFAFPATAASPGSGIGINLNGIADWHPNLPFANVFKQARPWHPVPQDSKLDLDEKGWIKSLKPGQKAGSYVMSSGNYPEGDYLFTYDGRGKVELGGDPMKVVGRNENGTLFHITPKKFVAVDIIETDPKDPVRNVRLYLPSVAKKKGGFPTFNPEYVQYLRGFNVIRFMSLASTNNSKIKEWQDRVLPSDAPNGYERGVAYESMVELTNSLDADPWFTIPHLATDNFVKHFAQFLKENVKKDKKIYIEYSNEVWNSMFSQNNYAIRMETKASQGADEKSEAGIIEKIQNRLFAKSEPKEKINGDRFYARRSIEIFKIFENVFGGAGRLVRVISGHAPNRYRARKLLEYPGLADHADAYAIAPYIGHDTRRSTIEAGPDAILDQLENELVGYQQMVRANQAMAEHFGLKLIAYEAGQHLTGVDSKNVPICAAPNRSPRMKNIYQRYLNIWAEETGNSLMVLFADMDRASHSGCWGLSESYQDKDPPKLEAVKEFMRANGQLGK